MRNDERPPVSASEMNKPMNKGGDLPPLPLLPDREWLMARIKGVEYRFAMFNGQIQYVTRIEINDAGEEEEVAIMDDDGEKIARKEFNVKFELDSFSLPNNKGPRCCWLTMGASLGEKAHLPTFLFNVLGEGFEPDSPQGIVDALEGLPVKLQLKNKPNKKDSTRPPYQNVIYDAVLALSKVSPAEPPEPIFPGTGDPTGQPTDKDMPF